MKATTPFAILLFLIVGILELWLAGIIILEEWYLSPNLMIPSIATGIILLSMFFLNIQYVDSENEFYKLKWYDYLAIVSTTYILWGTYILDYYRLNPIVNILSAFTVGIFTMYIYCYYQRRNVK